MDNERPQYIQQADASVRDLLSASTDLRTFRKGVRDLTTLQDRQCLVEQALILMEQNYVHLPLKTAMYGVNPVQRLRLLRRQLKQQTEKTMPKEWLFHAEMSEIFHSVRDLHTNYLLPTPYAGKIAFLPFLIEECTDGGSELYLVTHVADGFTGFPPGTVVTHWNGIPISEAVDLHAARFAGSNAAARHSRGVESLTLRPLRIHLPPFEEWVTINYTENGKAKEWREHWQVVENLPRYVDADTDSSAAVYQALDLAADETGRAKVLLFKPKVVAQQQAVEAGEATQPGLSDGDVATNMPKVFKARKVETKSGTFGHIRIFTFNVQTPEAFVEEFVRLIGELPQNGLIVDVRDNGGGHIHAAEFLLQVLTPSRIVPEPVQFINTALNLEICRQDGRLGLGAWVPSMEQAVETGATFSRALPITPEDGANDRGQRYFGPVVLITNARCYSATDIFSAGFQDHHIGPVLGTDDNTGAGGANVWTHQLLSSLLDQDPDTPYKPLPHKADMRVAIRRTLRVGDQSGTPVEDLGVIPKYTHEMTRNDVLNGNPDLLDAAGELLQKMPTYAVSLADYRRVDGALQLTLQCTNIDRVDIYLDQRPRKSVDLADGQVEVTVPEAATARSARLDGFANKELVASRREPLD